MTISLSFTTNVTSIRNVHVAANRPLREIKDTHNSYTFDYILIPSITKTSQLVPFTERITV
jgi:hypothetical protein